MIYCVLLYQVVLCCFVLCRVMLCSVVSCCIMSCPIILFCVVFQKNFNIILKFPVIISFYTFYPSYFTLLLPSKDLAVCCGFFLHYLNNKKKVRLGCLVTLMQHFTSLRQSSPPPYIWQGTT